MSVNKNSHISSQNHADALGIAFSQDVRPFIDLIDNLRRLGLQQDINLPNVVVVGDQSSGKSSIIEAISGIELPRGKNIVTRCPLELQLKKVLKKPWKATLTYRILDGTTEKIEIVEPHEVERYVREAQQKMCKTKKGISAELITLRVESPAKTAPDLTLIDLPGIARIAIEDQPKDICQQIKGIIMQHVENENTVILCVVSAHLDAAVNESIQIAKEVDPNGKRTFGVITKPDMADDEIKEEVLCLLNNDKIPLVKGYHMVKCRSQKDLERNLSLEESLENERNFFQEDRYYCNAHSSLLGTMNLASRITDELVQVIKSTLPELERNVDVQLQLTADKLSRLGLAIPESDQGKRIYLFELMKDMSRDINSFLNTGKIDNKNESIFHKWRKLFTKFKNDIQALKIKSMSKEFSVEKLQDEILKGRNNEISGFINFQLFQSLIKSHVVSYKSKAKFLSDEMKDKTSEALFELIDNNFRHLPLIAAELRKLTTEQLNLSNKETLDRINIIFEEENLVFVMDEAIQKEMKILEEAYSNAQNANSRNNPRPAFHDGIYLVERHFTDAEEMHNIIGCYLKIVHVRLADRIPMTIRQCLHVEFNKFLDRKFIEYSATNEVLTKVEENHRLIETRKNLVNKKERLQLAKLEIKKL